MSTAVRIIILVVEILAYIIMFLLKDRSLKRRMDYDREENTINRYVEFAGSIVILVLIIIFSFPAHIFLSYKKLFMVGAFLLNCSLWFLNNKKRIAFYEKDGPSISLLLLEALLVIAIIIVNTHSIFQPKKFVDSDSTQETYFVEKELKDIGNGKIAEVVDENGKTTKYFFITEEDDGNEIIEVVEPLNLRHIRDIYPNESAYIEKFVYTRMYKYPELKEETTEENVRIVYRFYINPELITQIKM